VTLPAGCLKTSSINLKMRRTSPYMIAAWETGADVFTGH